MNTTCAACGEKRYCGQFIMPDGEAKRVCGDCWDKWEKNHGQYPTQKTGGQAGGGHRVIRGTNSLT